MTTGLSSQQVAVLDAVLARLIPTDETGPGAREANVLRYVEGALATAYAEHLSTYSDGLSALDAYATSRFGADFVALSPERQDAILVAVESGDAEGFTPSSDVFFELLRRHAMEGMFGDPAWGGNDNFVGWELLGYPGPRLEWTEEEQQLDVVVPPRFEAPPAGPTVEEPEGYR